MFLLSNICFGAEFLLAPPVYSRISKQNCHSEQRPRGSFVCSQERARLCEESAFAVALVAQNVAHFAKICGFSASLFATESRDER